MFAEEFNIESKQKALLISVVCAGFDGHNTEDESLRSLRELKELLRTLGINYVDSIIQNKKTIEAATILGKGKIHEIAKKGIRL